MYVNNTKVANTQVSAEGALKSIFDIFCHIHAKMVDSKNKNPSI
jgi:hypothetical protein